MLETLRRTVRAVRRAAGPAALAAGLAVNAFAAGAPDPRNAAGRPVLDARLRYLLVHRDDTPLARAERLPVTLRFAAAPGPGALEAAALAGARFHSAPADPGAARVRPGVGAALASGARVLGGRTVFPADVAPGDLEALAALPGVERIETAWSPQPPQAPLYRTRALVGAEQAWALHDPLGRAVLGTGVRIADLDSGVDLYHPDYWRDDGPVRTWFDLDSDGTLTNGDAVDLDGNGAGGPGETLRWLDAPGTAPGQTGTMNPTIDHVYVDANGNGARDWGPPAFSEAHPAFGELVLRPRDLDGNGVITPGEPLVELHTCKVRAIYQSNGVVRRAGVDLIQNEGDIYGHGANVASILVGGEPGRRFGGIAPGAELLMANLAYGPDPPFVTPFDVRMAWAAAEGADILLYEDGEWIWLFLDGSSNVETLIGDYAAAGIVQVTAAGNLATGQMHWDGPLGGSPGDSAVAVLTVAGGATVTRGWGQLYWVPRPGESLVVEVRTPTGERLTLGGAGSTQGTAQYDVWSATDVSPRGTVRVDYGLSLAAGAGVTEIAGTWRFVVRRAGSAPSPLTVHAMAWDEMSGWSGFSNWLGATTRSTVTWPATADSAIVVAAFEPGGGALNAFSGRGPRVDGRAILDVAAPGSTTYTARRRQGAAGGVPGGYSSFGGTSAALPHVAGSLALLRQWLPDASHAELRALLRASAKVDAQTGAVPNDDWGWGKLDVYGAAVAGVADAPPVPPAAPGLVLAPAVPNPLDGATELAYALPAAGLVTVEVIDLAGRVVARLERGRQSAGAHRVRWDGRTPTGARAVPGVFLIRVELDGVTAARKVTVLR